MDFLIYLACVEYGKINGSQWINLTAIYQQNPHNLKGVCHMIFDL